MVNSAVGFLLSCGDGDSNFRADRSESAEKDDAGADSSGSDSAAAESPEVAFNRAEFNGADEASNVPPPAIEVFPYSEIFWPSSANSSAC